LLVVASTIAAVYVFANQSYPDTNPLVQPRLVSRKERVGGSLLARGTASIASVQHFFGGESLRNFVHRANALGVQAAEEVLVVVGGEGSESWLDAERLLVNGNGSVQLMRGPATLFLPDGSEYMDTQSRLTDVPFLFSTSSTNMYLAIGLNLHHNNGPLVPIYPVEGTYVLRWAIATATRANPMLVLFTGSGIVDQYDAPIPGGGANDVAARILRVVVTESDVEVHLHLDLTNHQYSNQYAHSLLLLVES
jgi:hypothetical protein